MTKAQRLKRSGFKKIKYSSDDLMAFLENDVSHVHFKTEQGKVSAWTEDGLIGAGGKDMKEALEWLIIARFEKDNPLPENE